MGYGHYKREAPACVLKKITSYREVSSPNLITNEKKKILSSAMLNFISVLKLKKWMRLKKKDTDVFIYSWFGETSVYDSP